MRKISVQWLVAFVLVVGLVIWTSITTFCAGPSSGVPASGLTGRSAVVPTAPFEPIKILVDNGVKRERQGEPVSVGIPLRRESAPLDTSGLCLTDAAGRIIPTQFRILARWGPLDDTRSPIKWVLVDFQADAPAAGTSIYYLKAGSQPPLTPLKVRKEGGAVTVDTGTVSFSIAKNRTGLFKNLSLSRGNAVVRPDGFNGFSLYRKDEGYQGNVESLRLEDAGPLRVSLCVKGTFVNKRGELFRGGNARSAPDKDGKPVAENRPLTYTARLSAYRNSGLIRIDYTLENEGNGIATYYPINDVFIDGSYLELIPLPSKMTVSGLSFAEYASPSDTFVLRQLYQLQDKKDEKKNFSYAVTLNERTVSSGVRTDGWVDLSATDVGMALGIRNFWQNAPKSVEYDKGILRLGLLPAKGVAPESHPQLTRHATGTYFFSAGWHKTHELALYVHDEVTRQDAGKELQTLTTPLVAHCEPRWYGETGVWGPLVPSEVEFPAEVGEAVSRYNRYPQMFVHPTATTPDINQLREERNQGATHYGWEHFGDLVWGGGVYCSLHYDWPYIMWLQFLRSGDSALYTMALQMTEHSADLDQIHNSGPESAPTLFLDGLWQWEQIGYFGGHHKSGNASGHMATHTWNGGYALGYLLTGNRRYLEAAERGAAAARRIWDKAVRGEKKICTETRSQGWCIDMLVNLYRINGDRKLLKDALSIFRNSLLYAEQLKDPPGSGGKGYISYSDKTYKDKVIVTFASYPLQPLCNLHYEAKQAGLDTGELERYLVRDLRWLKEYAFVGGKTGWDGLYSLLTISYATDPVNPSLNKGGTLEHNVFFADAFAYGSVMLKESDPPLSREFFLFGRHLFRDLMLYRAVSRKDKDSFVNPERKSAVTWGGGTKELGWIGRSGQYYLWAESLQTGQ